MDIEHAIELLRKQVGKPYIFGYEVLLSDPDPKAFDCSELVEWVFHQAFALKVPDGAANQFDFTLPVNDFKPFDLGFLRNLENKRVFHVTIRITEEFIIHAKGTEYGVVEQTVESWLKNKTFSGWRRLPGF